MNTQTKRNERRTSPDRGLVASRGLAVQTAVKGGKLATNHNQTLLRGLAGRPAGIGPAFVASQPGH